VGHARCKQDWVSCAIVCEGRRALHKRSTHRRDLAATPWLPPSPDAIDGRHAYNKIGIPR